MSHQHDHSETKNLGMAFILNFLFAILELFGGLWTNSLAILSDALHDLGDSFSLGMAWYFQRLSSKTPDERFTYGYRRYSLLGALINGLILFGGSVLIIYHAIPRIIAPEEAHAPGMIVLAVVGIVVNGAAAFRLRSSHSINSRVVRLHLLEDVLGWVAVLIGAVVIHYTQWYVIDSLLSLGIAIYILVNVYRNLKESISVILQTVPSKIDLLTIQKEIAEVSGVCDVHDLHIWSLDGERNILTAHIVVDVEDPASQDGIKESIKNAMEAHSVVHCTLELERPGGSCQELTSP